MRNRWPQLIVILLAGFLSLTAWSFHRAAREASAVTDSDYYGHGLRFDQTQLERKKAASLGWDAQATLSGRQLRVTLRDRRQRPVTNAAAELTLAAVSGRPAVRLPLKEDAEGIYSAPLPPALRGEQSAQVDFELDGARLSKRLLLSLP